MRLQMNDLRKAFRLECFTMKHYRPYFYLSLLFATLIIFFTVDKPALMPLYIQLFFSGFLGIFTANLFTFQRKHRLDWLYHILPPKQATFVASRFLFVCLHHWAGAIISLLAYLLMREMLSLAGFLLCLSGGLFISACLIAVQMLLLYAFGAQGQIGATLPALFCCFAPFTEAAFGLSFSSLPLNRFLPVALSSAPLILLLSIAASVLIPIAAIRIALQLLRRRNHLE